MDDMNLRRSLMSIRRRCICDVTWKAASNVVGEAVILFQNLSKPFTAVDVEKRMREHRSAFGCSNLKFSDDRRCMLDSTRRDAPLSSSSSFRP
jgi:hypothetical protein